MIKTLPMTSYKRGDILLVGFEFSEGGGSKKRPALVVSGDRYHRSRQEVIIAAITSNIQRLLFADTKIEHWKEAGLLYPSLVTGIIRTIKGQMIIKKLGALPDSDFKNVEKGLAGALQLG
jgi:mRNA interferase MazF